MILSLDIAEGNPLNNISKSASLFMGGEGSHLPKSGFRLKLEK